MTVYMIGTIAAADGGQGFFVWNSSVSGTDDGGVTTIVPYGVTQGCWQRDNPVVSASSPTSGGAITSIANIAALRALSTANVASAIWLNGYTTEADGGGGMFLLNATDNTSADNGGTLIVDAAGRRWNRFNNGLPWSIKWFGGASDGVTANDAAFSQMMAALLALSGGGSIVFPPGKYLFDAQQTVTYPGTGAYALSISGPSAVLYWPNVGGGLALNYATPGDRVEIDGVTFSTGVVSGGNALTISQSSPLNNFFQSIIRSAVFRGDDNTGIGGTFYWSNAAVISNDSGTAWEAVTVYGAQSGTNNYLGNGLVFQGAGSTNGYAIYHNIAKSIFNSCNVGVTYGSYAQGLTITQSNFQNTMVGVNVPANQSGSLSQLTIADSNFVCVTNNISVLSAVGSVFVEHNTIAVIGSAGVYLNVCQGAIITGNAIAAGTLGVGYGIYLNGTVSGVPATITGNTIINTQYGVFLTSSSANVMVANNSLIGTTTPFTNNGTNNTIGTNLT